MSKKWTKILKLAFVITLFVVVLNMTSNVYAQINQKYDQEQTTVKDTREDLNKKTESSVLLDAIGKLIYALASLGEWLIGIIFKSITEQQTFPWADKIIFNSINVLDINFLNPADNSLVGILREEVLQPLYGTIFGIAVSFFSVAVLIMGIKVAISTIASDKARYKEALWDWILGLVLLFTMHIFISFVFYLNESLVEIASEEASKAINTKGAEVIAIQSSGITDREMVQNFINAMHAPTGWLDFVTVGLYRFQSYVESLANKDAETYLLSDPEITELAAYLLSLESFQKGFLSGKLLKGDDGYWVWGLGSPTYIGKVAVICEALLDAKKNNNYELIENTIAIYRDANLLEQFGLNITGSGEFVTGMYYPVAATALEAGLEFVKTGKQPQSKTSLINNLADYFKKAAWAYGDTSWKMNKIVIQNALLYAILVVQSMMFLIAYMKRLFYVMILALMAPIVVVYDFFNKSIS